MNQPSLPPPARCALAALLIWIAVAGSGGAAAADTQNPPTPPGPTAGLKLAFGDANGVARVVGQSATFVLTISGLADVDRLPPAQLSAQAETLAVADTGKEGTSSATVVRFGKPQFLGRTTTNTLSWQVPISVEGLAARGTERRILTATIGAKESLVRYTGSYVLTAEPPAPPQFDVTAPGHDWIVSWSAANADRTYPLLIANKSEAIAGLRVGLTSLKSPDSGRAVAANRVKLLASADGAPVASVDLQPNESKTVFLRLDAPEGSFGPFGTFAGQIQLTSDGAPAKAVPLTVKLTSGGAKVFASVLVFLGLLTSLVVTNYLQPRVARLLALRPATMLRDRLLEFIATANASAVATDFAGLAAEARIHADRLTPEALDGGGLLPLDLNFATKVPNDAPAQLQKLLDEIAARLAGLMVLRDAVVNLAQQHPARPPAVAQGIADLNQFAPLAISKDAAAAEVTSVLAVINAVPGGLRAAPIPSNVTTQQISFMLHETANIATAIWATVSFAIGVTYIYSSVAFGTPLDLLEMYLWGFGLTTFGAGIQQLTPKSVATQIGLPLPN